MTFTSAREMLRAEVLTVAIERAASTPDAHARPLSGLAAPSAYQAAVFEHVERSRGHAVVMATAGSGKTTTLVEVARRLPGGTRACFLAFNRSTAAELRSRLPNSVDATTIHALGRSALARHHAAVGAAVPDASKYRRLARELVAGIGDQVDESARPGIAAYLAALANFARLELTAAHDLTAVAALLPRYGLTSPVMPELLPQLHALLNPLLEAGTAAAARGSVDFTDMVYLPVVQRLQLERYDFVCVDEAQDLSRVTLALVMRLVASGARALFVGDPRQAIYAFAGADRHSLKRIEEQAAATVLPLSVSYRCPTRHVALARRFAPEMESAPGAATGSVRFIPESALARTARPGDLVMARTNAPLLGVAMAMAEAGVPATVLGEELAAELLDLARRIFPDQDRLPRAATEVVQRHAQAENRRLEFEYLADPRLGELQERNADAHRALALMLEALASRPHGSAIAAIGGLIRDRVVTYTELEQVTLRMFKQADAANAVVLSTIHKAKGREAKRTFLLGPENLGIGHANVEEEAVEANVLFVALTRAKRELVLAERYRGAVAARLRRHERRLGTPEAQATSVLERQWDEVLKLATVMARGPRRRWQPHPALSS